MKIKWYCYLQKAAKINPLDRICGVDSNFLNFVTKTVIQPILIIPQPSRECNVKWDYRSHGKDWECKCNDGKLS